MGLIEGPVLNTKGAGPLGGLAPIHKHNPSPKGGVIFILRIKFEGEGDLLIKESLTLNGLEYGLIPSLTPQNWREGVSRPLRGRGVRL